MNASEFGMFKILALPEHFSPEQLQMIVDGKLKNGDKVLIECDYWPDIRDDKYPGQYVIKLNSSNHITLHKVEEKMYTLDQVVALAKHICCKHCDEADAWDNNTVTEWFEQNMK